MRTTDTTFKRSYPETKEVEAYLKWFLLQYPTTLIYKNQNEGKRHPSLAKRVGIQAGIPDLHIVKSVGKWHSFYIEMKLPNGKGVISDMQKLIIQKLIEENHAVEIGYGWEDAMHKTKDFFNGHYMPKLVLNLVSQ
jgi:hypothetical protein